jgi:hypothetical protein
VSSTRIRRAAHRAITTESFGDRAGCPANEWGAIFFRPRDIGAFFFTAPVRGGCFVSGNANPAQPKGFATPATRSGRPTAVPSALYLLARPGRTPALEPPSLARTLSRLSVSTARKTLFSALSPQESAARPIPPIPPAVWLTLVSTAPASSRWRSPSRTSAPRSP